MPDDDGLVEFAEPGPNDNSSTSLFIVAEVDDQIVGGSLRHVDRQPGFAPVLGGAHEVRGPLGEAAQAADLVTPSYFRRGRLSPERSEGSRIAARARCAGNARRADTRLPVRPQDARSLPQRASLHHDLDSGRLAEGSQARLVAAPVLSRRAALVDRDAGEGSGPLAAREARSPQAQRHPDPVAPASVTPKTRPGRTDRSRGRATGGRVLRAPRSVCGSSSRFPCS
jgi:hypothetical protein